MYRALDARNGKYLWSTLVGHGDDPGGIQWGTAFDGKRIYAAIGHNTRQVRTRCRRARPSRAARGRHSIRRTAKSCGRRQIHRAHRTSRALTVANGVLYAGSMAHTGDQMNALDTSSGAILWRFSAGGSVVAGPAVVDGTVYWGSGYARTGGVGNNKFYAFSIDGRKIAIRDPGSEGIADPDLIRDPGSGMRNAGCTSEAYRR